MARDGRAHLFRVRVGVRSKVGIRTKVRVRLWVRVWVRVWVRAAGPACDGEVQLAPGPIYVDRDAKSLHFLHQVAALDVQAGHETLACRELLVEVERSSHIATAFLPVTTEGVSCRNEAASERREAPRSATFLLMRVELRISVSYTDKLAPGSIEDPVGDFDSMITLMQRLHATGGGMLGASLDLTPDA